MKKARRGTGSSACHPGLDPGSMDCGPARNDSDYAAASQYPALKGLLMRSAMGDTSSSLSVGIFSAPSVGRAMPDTASP